MLVSQEKTLYYTRREVEVHCTADRAKMQLGQNHNSQLKTIYHTRSEIDIRYTTDRQVKREDK